MKHTCTAENAAKFWDWIKNRGGVAVWHSANLSNPGASWSSPALTLDGHPTPKPTWQAEDTPEILTNPDEITVCYDKEVARLPIALKRGSGLQILLTDASSRRVRAAVAKAGKGAYYAFEFDEAVILAPERTVTLTEWAREKGLL